MGTFTPSCHIYSMNTILINIGNNKMENITTIKDVKENGWITLKEIEEPKENQVWVRNHYDKATKTYSITNWSTGRERFLKGDRIVFVNFTF